MLGEGSRTNEQVAQDFAAKVALNVAAICSTAVNLALFLVLEMTDVDAIRVPG